MASFLARNSPAIGFPYAAIYTGDSIAIGFDPDGAVTPYSSLIPLASSRLNTAVSGQRLDQMIGRLAAFEAPWAPNAVIVVEGGFNDILQSDPNGLNYQPTNGRDGAGAYARLQAYVAQMRTHGPRRILMLTCLSMAIGTTYYTPYIVGEIAAYNGLIVGTPSLFDGIVDITTPSVTRSSTDGFHPNQAGQSTIAGLAAPIVNAALL